MSAIKQWMRAQGFMGRGAARTHVFMDGGKASVHDRCTHELYERLGRCAVQTGTSRPWSNASPRWAMARLRRSVDIDFPLDTIDARRIASDYPDALPRR
jgi:hypothetical protein